MLCSARSFASQPQRMKEDLQHWEVFRSTHPWLLTERGIGFFVARMPGWINAVSLSLMPPSGEDSCLEKNAEFIISDSICNQYLFGCTASSYSNNVVFFAVLFFFYISIITGARWHWYNIICGISFSF